MSLRMSHSPAHEALDVLCGAEDDTLVYVEQEKPFGSRSAKSHCKVKKCSHFQPTGQCHTLVCHWTGLCDSCAGLQCRMKMFCSCGELEDHFSWFRTGAFTNAP